jgi:hypothetical protein
MPKKPCKMKVGEGDPDAYCLFLKIDESCPCDTCVETDWHKCGDCTTPLLCEGALKFARAKLTQNL